MEYMLDTNICSYIIKNRPREVLRKFNEIPMEDCVISSITLAELNYWVARNKRLHQKSNNSGQPNVNELVIYQFVSHLRVEKFDSIAAKIYGDVRAELESKGKIIGSEDLLIGAHALSRECVLVTNNLKEFKKLPGIKLENWVSRASR